jgi:hypothetical protein
LRFHDAAAVRQMAASGAGAGAGGFFSAAGGAVFSFGGGSQSANATSLRGAGMDPPFPAAAAVVVAVVELFAFDAFISATVLAGGGT